MRLQGCHKDMVILATVSFMDITGWKTVVSVWSVYCKLLVCYIKSYTSLGIFVQFTCVSNKFVVIVRLHAHVDVGVTMLVVRMGCTL